MDIKINDYIECYNCNFQGYTSRYYNTPYNICPKCESNNLIVLQRDSFLDKLNKYIKRKTIGSNWYFKLRFFPFVLYYNLHVYPKKLNGKYCHFKAEDEVMYIKATRINNNWFDKKTNRYLAENIGKIYKIISVSPAKIDKHRWEHYTLSNKPARRSPNYMYMRIKDIPRMLLFIFNLFRLKEYVHNVK